ncbi:MAG: hypothetical protein AAF447_19675 [Myxococcota bacterium]
MAAYSGAHGLNVHTLKNWVYRLAKEEKKAKASGFARVRRRRSKVPATASASFEALRVHCGGVVVEVPSSFDAQSLGRVLEVLRSADPKGGAR